MHFLLLLFLLFFNVLHGSIWCHLLFLIYTWTTYQMIQYPLSRSFVDDVLLSFITLINAKTWSYELNSDFKNKSEWTLYHFMNSDLKKQAQALEVTFSRKTKSYHSQTCFNNILRIYLNEKLNFYHHIIERNAQMHIRSENLFY